MKYTLIGAVLFCVASPGHAQTFGVAIGIAEETATVSLPIEVRSDVRIIPFGSLTHSKYSNGGNNRGSYRYVALGVGVLREVLLENSLSLLYGSRLGYQNSVSTNEYVQATGSVSGNSFKGHGLIAGPTIGLEYKFTKHLFITGEVAYEYSRLRGNNVATESASTVSSRSYGQTTSLLRLQYMGR